MSEFAPNETILPIQNNEQEKEKNAENIFEAFDSRAFIPEKPLVRPEEGFHLRVEPKTEMLPYFNKEGKIADTLKPFLLAMATARTELGTLDDQGEENLWSQWVNLHCLPRFGGQNHLQFEVIGRNARGETWAQPIDYPKNEDFDNQPSVVINEARMIQRDLSKNAENVAKEAQDVVLFENPETESQYTSDEKTIFQFQKYDIRAPRENPHIEEGGLHLWIHTNTDEKNEGVQSNVKNGVEQFILASAVAKSIYSEMGIPIEIHFSGNWGLPIEGHWKENLSAHANLYGAPKGKENVALPERPGYQRPSVPEETRQNLKQALEKNMSSYVQEFVNFQLKSLDGVSNES